MHALQEIEQLLTTLTRAEKAQVLQWVVRDLGDAFPGIERTTVGGYHLLLGVIARERDVKEQLMGIDETTVRTHRLGLAEIVHTSFVRELLDSIGSE